MKIKETIKRVCFICGDSRTWNKIITIPWIIMATTLSVLGFIDQGTNGLFLGLLISLLYGATLFIELIPIVGIFAQFASMTLMSDWLYQVTETIETPLTLWCFWMYIVLGITINFIAISITIKYCIDSRHEI